MRNARSDRWSLIAKLKQDTNISAPRVEERRDTVMLLVKQRTQGAEMFVYLVSISQSTELQRSLRALRTV